MKIPRSVRFWKYCPALTAVAVASPVVVVVLLQSLLGSAPVNACPVGGAAVAEKVGAIMGIEASASEPVAAFVKCGGTCETAKMKYDYFGIDDCNMAVQLAGGGAKSCTYGCLGLGSCKKLVLSAQSKSSTALQ